MFVKPTCVCCVVGSSSQPHILTCGHFLRLRTSLVTKEEEVPNKQKSEILHNSYRLLIVLTRRFLV